MPSPTNPIDRDTLVALIRRIIDIDGSQDEIDELVQQLNDVSALPGASDLIFHSDDELSAEQIADAILAYQPERLGYGMDRQDPHYRAIATFYGDRSAARSGVALIRHIEEGLAILERIGAPLRAMQAYCLHPLVQDDEDLRQSCVADSILLRHQPDPGALMLAMEYRRVANAYLSRHCTGADDAIALSPLAEVNQMLIADKVQNRKEFEIHHLTSHAQSARLTQYFANWLKALGVSEARYQQLRLELALR